MGDRVVEKDRHHLRRHVDRLTIDRVTAYGGDGVVACLAQEARPADRSAHLVAVDYCRHFKDDQDLASRLCPKRSPNEQVGAQDFLDFVGR